MTKSYFAKVKARKEARIRSARQVALVVGLMVGIDGLASYLVYVLSAQLHG